MARNQLEQLEHRHLLGVPFAQYQYVDVVFGGTANLDTVVEHQLPTTDPEAINYEVVRKDRTCDVYHDPGVTRRAWGAGFIVLRSTVANATVRLRLSTEPS